MLKNNLEKKFLCKISLIVILFYFFDILSKILAKNLLEKKDVELFFSSKFTLAFNEGIAFSIPITGVIQIIITIGILLVLINYAFKNWNLKNNLEFFSLSLILGGAFGNLHERIIYGKVTDFISIFPWFATFNLADSFIFIGAGLALFIEFKSEKLKKNIG